MGKGDSYMESTENVKLYKIVLKSVPAETKMQTKRYV